MCPNPKIWSGSSIQLSFAAQDKQTVGPFEKVVAHSVRRPHVDRQVSELNLVNVRVEESRQVFHFVNPESLQETFHSRFVRQGVAKERFGVARLLFLPAFNSVDREQHERTSFGARNESLDVVRHTALVVLELFDEGDDLGRAFGDHRVVHGEDGFGGFDERKGLGGARGSIWCS